MKPVFHTLTVVLALSTAPLLCRAELLITDSFETYIAGTNIDGQGLWTAPSVSGVMNEVSSNVAYEGSNSLLVSDNSTAGGGRAILNVGSTLDQGILSFAIMEDPGDAVRDDWTVVVNDFAGISLNTWGTSLFIKKYGPGYSTEFSVGKTFAEIGYDSAGWNYFSIDFDNVAKAATIYLNEEAIFVSTNTSTSDWSLSNAYFQSGSNAATGDLVYYDAVSVTTGAAVPEPATYAGIFGLAVLAFSVIKRRATGRKTAA
jgi:hypothetical protein